MSFDRQGVVVTGATGALGTAVVARLRRGGAVVHVPSRTPRGELAARGWPFADDPEVVVTAGIDLADDEQVARFFATVPALVASIHVAGGFAMAPIADTPTAELRRLFEQNAVTTFAACRAAIASMRATGRGGRIVNVTARPALVATGGMSAYAVSKSAVAAMTVALAREVGPEGIFVNAVAPGTIDTPANRAAMPAADRGGWASAESIAETIAFLASTGNTATNGAIVPVYGRG
jgi:NAD(P)-dependent dehydrogenase (short-subunit alcohol dehydrogenase family)